MAVRIGVQLHWLWRAVDEHGQTLDVLLRAQRDTAVAKRRLPELATPRARPGARRSAVDDRVEQAHQPTRTRERVMRRFRSAPSPRRCLDACSRVCNRLRPRRHLLGAAAYRAARRERVAMWRKAAGPRLA